MLLVRDVYAQRICYLYVTHIVTVAWCTCYTHLHTHFFAFLALIGPLIFPPYDDPSHTIQHPTMALYSGHCHVPCSHAGRHTQANVPKATCSRSQAGGHMCASKQASKHVLGIPSTPKFSNKYPWTRNWKLTLQLGPNLTIHSITCLKGLNTIINELH